MSHSPRPPPLPTVARPSKPVGTPSHAAFLLDQIRASLAQLYNSKALDAITYREVESKLSRAILREPPPPSNSLIDSGTQDPTDGDSEEAKLGKRNAWARKALTETEVLPAVVEAALTTVAGPFLSETSIDAIVELVSLSQKSIAAAVTDPKKQQTASSATVLGLKGAHTGVTRSIVAANSSLAEMNRRREEKAEQKRQENKERKQLQRELKQERREIKERIAARTRKEDQPQASTPPILLSRSNSPDAGFPCPTCGAPDGKVLPSAGGDFRNGSSDGGAVVSSSVSESDEGVSAAASVACTWLSPASYAATTTFAPRPDLRVSSTLVISTDLPPRGLAATAKSHPMESSKLSSTSEGPGLGMHALESRPPVGPDPFRSVPEDDRELRGDGTPPLAALSGEDGNLQKASQEETEGIRRRWQQHHSVSSPTSGSALRVWAETGEEEEKGQRIQPIGGLVTSMSGASASSQPRRLMTSPLPSAGAVRSAPSATPPPPPLHPLRPAMADRSEQEEVVDVTDKKRKGWKAKLLS